MGELNHVFHGIEGIEKLPPLPKEKSRLSAFIYGFLFGCFGVGLYFKSWTDFFYLLLMAILIGVALPGLGLFVGAIIAGCYGAYRAHTSNEKLAKELYRRSQISKGS